MEQQNYNSNEERKLIQGESGPVFESKPGWGGKTKNWFIKYLYKLILPIIIVALVGYGLSTRKGEEPADISLSPTPIGNDEIIIQEVQRGDSLTVIARRALAEYLGNLKDETLSVGQKIFIENRLSQTITASALIIGSTIEVKIDDIQSFIEESKQLTQSQLQKWAEFARKAGIK